MDKKFTFLPKLAASLILLVVSGMAISSFGQTGCDNPISLYSEDFGTGTIATSHPDITSRLVYQEAGQLVYEGRYRVINNTHQKYEWHTSPDHTGNVNGKMLVVNGQSEEFFRHLITTTTAFTPGNYTFNLFSMNVNTPGTCTDPLLTALTYTVEYLDQSSNWVSFSGSPYTAAPLQQLAAPTWIPQTTLFVLPSTPGVVTQIRLTISDGVNGGCGNDFALDDIEFGICSNLNPGSGPTPVTFGDITARQKGGGVSIDWTTYQELNSSYFDIEKSVDGNYGWTYIGSQKAAGNSGIKKQYSGYDPKPFSGYNFYRLKQVDIDGKFKYSKTVSVKVDYNATGISVLANPYRNSLTLDLVSGKDESLTARMFDMTGKQVAVDKWTITRGHTRKNFLNADGLKGGMYILSVTNAQGEILFNGKVLKQ